MTNHNDKEETKDGSSLPSIAAGAAILGGIAAAAVMLSNEDNRDKLKDTFKKANDSREEMVDDVMEKGGKVASEAVKIVSLEYDILVKRLDVYIKNTKNSAEADKLESASDDLAKNIEKAEAAGDEVSDKLIETIKTALKKLGEKING